MTILGYAYPDVTSYAKRLAQVRLQDEPGHAGVTCLTATRDAVWSGGCPSALTPWLLSQAVTSLNNLSRNKLVVVSCAVIRPAAPWLAMGTGCGGQGTALMGAAHALERHRQGCRH